MRGGKRENAGRNMMGAEKRVNFTLTLAPGTVRFLKKIAQENNISVSLLIENFAQNLAQKYIDD